MVSVFNIVIDNCRDLFVITPYRVDNFLLDLQDIDGNGVEQNVISFSTICFSTGHFVPTQAPQRKAYTEFLEQFINKT